MDYLVAYNTMTSCVIINIYFINRVYCKVKLKVMTMKGLAFMGDVHIMQLSIVVFLIVMLWILKKKVQGATNGHVLAQR